MAGDGEERKPTQKADQKNIIKKQVAKLHYVEIKHICVGCLHFTKAARRATARTRK